MTEADKPGHERRGLGPHHKRTRSGGEQQGTTVKAAEPAEAVLSRSPRSAPERASNDRSFPS